MLVSRPRVGARSLFPSILPLWEPPVVRRQKLSAVKRGDKLLQLRSGQTFGAAQRKWTFFFVSTKRTVSAAIAGATEVPVRGANSNTHRPPQKKAGGLGDPTPETRQAGPPTSSAPATSSRSRRPARGLLFPLHPRRGSFPRGPRSP